jgi:hypothetical protein
MFDPRQFGGVMAFELHQTSFLRLVIAIWRAQSIRPSTAAVRA